jgi:2-polyprenyl-6-methoxyphenol hydroxylase-like FAD-dependent oxidoreductase
MTQHQVLIAGGGPTGMMLAAELTLGGIDVAIVERRTTPELLRSGALGLHSRTLEVFDQRGIVDRFLAAGRTAQVAGFGHTLLNIADFPSRHPHGLALMQKHIERIMAGRIDELGVPVYRGREIAGFTEDADGVDLMLADGETMRCLYLAGCDGGRSVVRKTAGIGFVGSGPTLSHLIAEVEFTDEPPHWGMFDDAIGRHALSTLEDGATRGVMVTERSLEHSREPTLADLSEAMVAVWGTDFGARNPRWVSRFTDAARQAETYRKGRVLLAGDAAHIHYPAGGQGLNTGVQDAVNLGWKLTQVVKGTSPDNLLDSYGVERHPVAARVLRYTLAAVAAGRGDDRSRALNSVVADLLGLDQARKLMGGMMSELDIAYDFGASHPLVGRRMPDLDLITDDGSARVYGLMHGADALLLNLGWPAGVDITGWADRVRLVEARYEGVWELPVLGVVPSPAAVLIRPDGHVAWVGDHTRNGLVEALTQWFGPAA